LTRADIVREAWLHHLRKSLLDRPTEGTDNKPPAGSMKRQPRKTANLSASIHQQLSMYALAAGAAGVGTLALAQPSEAKIVYTPANRRLHYGLTRLDLDKLKPDADFEFCLSLYIVNSSTGTRHPYSCPSALAHARKSRRPPSGMASALSIYPHGGTKNTHNRIWGTSNGAFALPRGVRVGPGVTFNPGGKDMATWGSTNGFSSFFGPWANVQDRYLGLEFLIKGRTHYGWARLTVVYVPYHPPIKATLTGYAYETIPGKSIITGRTKGPDDRSSAEQPRPVAHAACPPEPATLGALAMGAPGLSIWRRKESVVATPESN
jgi:hypothetical protein